MISIIIPVYNTEEHLSRCIESILGQSYINFEAIFINDGSKDNSLSILKKHAKIDSRIIILDKKNEGSGEARNMGIENSKGEYICFVDSDDWLNRDYLKLMYEDINKSKVDIVMCNPIIAYDDESKNIKIQTGKFKQIDLQKNPEKIVDLMSMPVLWNKLYRKKVLIDNQIKFPKFLYHEDSEFLYKLFLNIKKISKIEFNLYYYYKRENSITGTLNKKNIFDAYIVLDNIQNYILENKKEEINNFKKYKINFIYGTKVEGIKKIDKSLKNEWEMLIKKNIKNIKYRDLENSKKTCLFYLAIKFKQEERLYRVIKYTKKIINKFDLLR